MVPRLGNIFLYSKASLPGVVKVLIPIVGILILLEVVSPAALKKNKLYLNIN